MASGVDLYSAGKWILDSVRAFSLDSSNYNIDMKFSLSRIIPGYGFIRVAGISGVLAVVMGTYGVYIFNTKVHVIPKVGKKEVLVDGNLMDIDLMKRMYIYDVGFKIHLFHTCAFLAIPLTRMPYLVGSFMLAGVVLLAGSCYYEGFFGNRKTRFSPYLPMTIYSGGAFLMAAWLSMVV